MKWTDLEEQVILCIKCGACQQVCPIFRELRSEASVARGKINLMKAVVCGDLNPATESFAERMSWCLSCKACQENCPRGVRFDQMLVAARNLLAAKDGRSRKRLLLRLGLKHRRLFNAALQFGSVGQRLFFRRGPNGEGMLPRLPMGLDLRRLVASLATLPFRSRHPQVVKAPGATRKVAFFTGCMVNYLYPEIGDAVLTVLGHNGVTVTIPPTQHCCGTPAYYSGDVATAMELAKATVDTFAGLNVDAVVTACGSCGATLRNEYPELLKDEPSYAERSCALARKTIDFTELLADHGLQGKLAPVQRTVTYHDSCHLARGQKVKQQPRSLITSIPGVSLKEMQQPAACCGGAGSFSLQHYDLSLKISRHKVDSILATQADTLAIGCPMCIMHMRDSFNQNGVTTKVVHTAELLAAAYDADKSK